MAVSEALRCVREIAGRSGPPGSRQPLNLRSQHADRVGGMRLTSIIQQRGNQAKRKRKRPSWSIADTSSKTAQDSRYLLARPTRTEPDFFHLKACLFGQIGEPFRCITFAYMSPVFDLLKWSIVISIHWNVILAWCRQKEPATWSKDTRQ